MRLNSQEIQRCCQARGIPLTRLLREAEVSRTAYYSLLRRDSILPGSVLKLAEALRVPPSELLDESALEERSVHRRLLEAKRIVRRNPKASFENVWHTLVLLDEPPIERLNRALRRGRFGTLPR